MTWWRRAGSMSAFEPHLRTLARVLPRRAVSRRTLRMVRWMISRIGRRLAADVELHRIGVIDVRLHRPSGSASETLPAILWIHGGGYVMGSAAQDDAIGRRLAANVGAVVAVVDYRLAPEHPFPTPLHDCHDALVWLAELPEVDAERIAIAGASAGGGLGAALALLARDRDRVQPVAQVLEYPMLDDRTVQRRELDDLDVRLWDQRANAFAWQAYTGLEPGLPEVSSLAAPARNDRLSGLPPAWIGVGSLDLFHDECIAYAERLRAAGVDCELVVVDGAFHGFDLVAPKALPSLEFSRSIDRVLATALAH